MSLSPIQAANVKQQPDPALLKRFEAERDAAQADKQNAQKKIENAQDKLRKIEQEEKDAEMRTQRELCKQGLLPSELCL